MKNRPTENATLVVGIIVGIYAFTQNHDYAALEAVVGGALPHLFTQVVEWWRSRHPTTTR